MMIDKKILPIDVTYLDIIKTIAVIIMVIDHIGYYFFSENDWFRAVGRACVPIWFFLIGYANTRELPNRLLIGALILAVADLIILQRVFPINILVAFIVLRLTLDYIMGFLLRSRYIYALAFVLMALSFFATNIIVEYGTLGLVFAILGYVTRHKDKIMDQTFFRKSDYIVTIIFSFVIFCVLQNAQFGFSTVQFCVMATFTATAMAALITIRPMTFPQIKGKTAVQFLQYCGRNTLDIYVAHLLAFKVIIFVIYALN